jgi:N-acetyl-anhydromuramyl-L-alanine amidase AmpD
MAYETDPWLYVPAKYPGPKRSGAVRLVVIHTAQWREHSTSAEALAKYGQNPDGGVKSWHIAVDSDTVIQCVKDSFVAYAAPGANHDGIQIELACRAEQTPAQWRDPYSLAQLAVAADATAQYCLKYDIPPVHLSDVELYAGHRGIIGHAQASRVYKKSTHTDPGPNFPWRRFILMVEALRAERRLVA